MMGMLTTGMLDATATLFSNSVLPVNHAQEVATKARLRRLRVRREQQGLLEYKKEGEPNYLRGSFLFHLQREKRAQIIGLHYWIYGKESVSKQDGRESLDQFHRPRDGHSFYRDYSPKNSELSGGMDAAHFGMGSSIELDCLSSFLASSVKNRLVDQYHLRNQPEAEKQPLPNDAHGISSDDSWNLTPPEMRITDKQLYQSDTEPFPNGAFRMQSEYNWTLTPPEFRITMNPQSEHEIYHQPCSALANESSDDRQHDTPATESIVPVPKQELESSQRQPNSKPLSRIRKSKSEQKSAEPSSPAMSTETKGRSKRKGRSSRRKSKADAAVMNIVQ